MNFADLFQTISLFTVAITIVIAAIQVRHAARQSHEAAHQSALARRALGQSAHQNTVSQSSTFLASITLAEPQLLSWFLATRGITPDTYETNKRSMLLYLRLEVHEATYLAYLENSMPEEVWRAWSKVIALDTSTPEFIALWRVVGDTYADRFAAFIDGLLSSPVPDEMVSVGLDVRYTRTS